MMDPCQQSEPFDAHQHRAFGNYVYALVDPRTSEIFYVGQATQAKGKGARIGSHYVGARDAIAGRRKADPKEQRIIQIWSAGLSVDAHIVRHGLRDERELDQVEGALISALNFPAKKLTNKANAPGIVRQGWLTPRQIQDAAAANVNPSVEIPLVHVFRIDKGVEGRMKSGLNEAEALADAVKRRWYTRRRQAPPTGVAVGTIGTPAISRIACQIQRWVPDEPDGYGWAFEPGQIGAELHGQLVERNWSVVISALEGARYFPTPLQVSFDGKGYFKVLSGVRAPAERYPLVLLPKALA